MMRSLSSAVAGLRTHQTKMDVIGNNIANVNTYGFKVSRTTFADVYYQNLSRGNGPTTTTGGTNPTQIGYGSAIATIDILNTQAGAASTDRALDVYITGEGFLVTQDANGNFRYTRLGNMGFDAEGNLIDGNGNYMMGFPQNADGTPRINSDGTAQASDLQPIQVNPDLLDQLTGISITATGEIIGVLPGDTVVNLGTTLPDWIDVGSIPSDSNLQGAVRLMLGGLPSDAQLSGVIGTGVSNVAFGDCAIDNTQPLTITSTANKLTVQATVYNNDGTTSVVTATGTVENGKVVLRADGDVLFSFDYSGTGFTPVTNNTAIGTTTKYYEMSTMDKGGNIVTSGIQAFTSGQTIRVGDSGTFELTLTSGTDPEFYAGTIGRITLSEGDKVNIGCLVLAKFRNAAGLEQVGNTQYATTENSGEAIYVRPGLEGTGSLKANYLEMSNVDISKEFTDMITTQRGFQANTRIVTVSDEMLQELVNLKR